MMKVAAFVQLLTAVCLVGVSETSVPPNEAADVRLTTWAESAYRFVKDANCDEAQFTSSAECRRVAQLNRSQMNIYAAYNQQSWPQSSNHGRYFAVLPDASLSKQGPHHAILTLDPFPQASFGHLVFIFLLQYNTTRTHCESRSGIYLTNEECMVLAHKSRCQNSVDRDGGRSDVSAPRRCEMNFLPLVHLEGVAPNQNNQQLHCYHLTGFAECVARRPKNETSKLICNPLDSNRHHCQLTNEMALHSRCRLLETCDQAVILTGGWNRDYSLPQSADNVAKFYHMLRNSGFHKDNVKVYYANGAHASQLVGEHVKSVYPSAMKLAFRYHLQKICQSPLCADSLVIYLNSPTTNDGHMLLWDVDSNGQMDSSETYSMRELMADVIDCTAHQLYLFVDQSYAGHLVNYFARSKLSSNVIVVGSGQEDEYSYNGEFTQYWTRPEQHLQSCVTQLHENSYSSLRMSRPTIHDGSQGALRTTLFGASCDIKPPFTKEELRSSYFGCQNVPTTVWLNRFMSTADEEDSQDDQ